MFDKVADAAAENGFVLRSVGLKDVILPGEMKDLLNKVTEAKKAAEAALITRRETRISVDFDFDTTARR